VADSLFDKILNGDISFTVAKDSDAQEQGTELPGVAKKAVGNPLGGRRALGDVIGGGLRKPPTGMVYVDITGAIDGDEDGIVFEGTPFKRPIIPRAVIPKNVAQAQSEDSLQRALNNESKRRGTDKPRGEMTDRDVADLYRRRSQPEAAGSRSRTDRYSIAERPLEDILTDLEMSEDEKNIARRQLRRGLEDVKTFIRLLEEADLPDTFHPGITRKQAIDLLKSIQIGVSSNGVPVISFDPHPLFSGYADRERNWLSIEAPSVDKIREFIDFLRPYISVRPYISDRKQPYKKPGGAPTAQDVFLSRTLDGLAGGLIDEDKMPAIDGDELYELNNKFATDLQNDKNFPSELSDALLDILRKSQKTPTSVPDLILSSIINPNKLILHDGVDHMSTGRGFDRHGEWAALIAGMKTNVDYVNDTYDEKLSDNDVRLLNIDYFRLRGGLSILQMQIDPEKLKLFSEYRDLDKQSSEMSYEDAIRRMQSGDDELDKKMREIQGKIKDLDNLLDDINLFLDDTNAGYVVSALEDRGVESPMDILDPRDESGNFINGSKSTTARYININNTKTELFNAAAEEQSRSTMHGSKSRTDRYSIVERPLDDILTDLEMSQGEREVARDVLERSQDKLRKLRELLADEDVPAFMHPGMTREEALAFIDSIKLSVSSNGVPVITFDRLPYIKSILGDIDPIGDDRNWETVEALNIPQLRNLIQVIMSSPELDPEIVDSLDPDILDSLPEGEAFAARDELTIEALIKTRQSAADELGISHDAVRGISFYGIALSQGAYIQEKLGIRRVDLIGSGGADVITELMSHLLDIGSAFDSYHDTMEHFGQGRGFDRHGEWVAFLAGMLHADAWIKREAERIGEESSAELDAVRKTLIQKYLFDQGLQQLLRQIETNKLQEIINFARENYDNANREQRLTEAVTNLLKAYVDVVNRIRKERNIQSGQLNFEELSKGMIKFDDGQYGNIVKRIVDSIDNWRFSNLDNLPAGAIVEFLNFQATNLSGNIKKIREMMRNTEPNDLYEEMFFNIFGRFGREGFTKLADLFMPDFRPQNDVTIYSLDEAIRRFPYSSLTADEIIELLDPRDSEGKPINGSKSTTRNATSFLNSSTDDIQAIVDETTPHHIAGSKSRTDRYPIGEPGPGGRERSLEDIATDLRLTDTELAIAEEAIMLAIEEVQDILANPDNQNFDPIIGKEQALDLLRALTLSVSSNGIPMIIGKPHPLISQFIPSEREWDLIELPTPDGLQKIFDLLSVGVDKLESTPQGERSQISDNILDIFQLVEKLDSRANMSRRMASLLRRYNDVILGQIARSVFESIYGTSPNDAISRLELRDIEYDSGNWIESYIAGLRNMVIYLMGNNQDITDIDADDRDTDWHDFFGHYGIGRAFDRHGEWANYLAIDSIIATDERFGEDKQLRNLLRLSAFFEYGWPLILVDSLDRQTDRLDRDSTKAFAFSKVMQDLVSLFNMYPVRFRDIDADELIDLIDQDHRDRINSGSKSSTQTNRQNLEDIDELDRITKAQLVDEFVRHENRKNGIADRRDELVSGSRSRTSGEYRMLTDVYKELNDMPSLKRELQKTKWKGKKLTLEEIDSELANDFPDFSGAIIDIPNMAIFDFSSRRRMANRRMNFERAFIGPDVRFANIDLRGSNFENSFLSSPRFSDVDASETSFANAIGAIKAGNSNFSAADFTGFQNTRHDEGDSSSIFIDSDLSEVRFTNSNIHMSVIRPRSMQNAYFVGASLRYLNIDGSNSEKELTSMLSGNIDEPSFINFDESNIGILNIKGINLSGSSFRRARTFHNISEITDFGDGNMVDRMMEALRDPSSMSISVDQMIDVDFSGAKLTFPRFGIASIDARTAAFVNFENAVLARMNIGIRSTAISEDAFYKAYGDFVRGNDKEVFFRAMGPDSAGINISGARLYNVGFGDQTQSGERSRINSLAIDERTRVTMGTESIRAIIDLDFPDDEVDPPFVFAEFAEEDFDSPNGRLIADKLKDSGARFISGSKSTTSGSGKELGVWSPPEDPDFFNKIVSDLYDRFSNREIEARQYPRVRKFTLDEILSDPLALTQSIDAYLNRPMMYAPEKGMDSLFERESLALAFQSFIKKLFEPLVENEEFQPMVDTLANYLIGKHGKAEAFKLIKKAAARGDFAKLLAEQFMTDIAMGMISMRAGGQIPLSDRENLRSQIDKYISKVGILSSEDKWFTPSGSKQVRREAFRFQEVAKSIVAATEFEKKPARRPRIDEKLKVEIDDLLPDIKRLDADMTKEIRRERKIVELEKDFSDGEVALDAVIEAGSRILERVILETERRTSELASKEFALLKDISDGKEKLFNEMWKKNIELREIEKEALASTLMDIKGKLLKNNDPGRKNLDDAALRVVDDIIKLIQSAEPRDPDSGNKSFVTSKINSIDLPFNYATTDNIIKESRKGADIGELMYKLLQTLVPGLPGHERGSMQKERFFLNEEVKRWSERSGTSGGYIRNAAYDAALKKAVSDIVNVPELMYLTYLVGLSADDREEFRILLSKPEHDQLDGLIEQWHKSLRKPASFQQSETMAFFGKPQPFVFLHSRNSEYYVIDLPDIKGGMYYFETPGFEDEVKQAKSNFYTSYSSQSENDEMLEEINTSFGLGIDMEILRKLHKVRKWDVVKDAIIKKHAQFLPNNRNIPEQVIDRFNSINEEIRKINEEIEVLNKGDLNERELIPSAVSYFGKIIDQGEIDASKKDLDSVLSILKQVLPPKVFEIAQQSIVGHYKKDDTPYRSPRQTPRGIRKGQSYSSGTLKIFTDNKYISFILGEYTPSGRYSGTDSPRDLTDLWPDIGPSGVNESLEDLRDAVVKALDESELSLYVEPMMAKMLTRREIEILRAQQLVEIAKQQEKQNQYEALIDVLGSTRKGFGYSPNSFQRYISNIHGREGHKHGDVRFWLESFRTIVPEEWIDALLKRKQRMKWLTRGYFSDGGREIALDRRGNTVLVHEIGHAIERAFPELVGFEALLFRYIAKKQGLSDNTVKTIKIPGDRERAWPLGLIPGIDELRSDYAAKVYGDHHAWELFTMIFQGLLADKNLLSDYDEDYVKWFLGVMATL